MTHDPRLTWHAKTVETLNRLSTIWHPCREGGPTGQTITLSHLKSFIESAVPPTILFLEIIMMTLKRFVTKEDYLIALFRKEGRNNFLMSGPWLFIAKLLPLLFFAPRWRCCYLIFSSCNVKFPRYRRLIIYIHIYFFN